MTRIRWASSELSCHGKNDGLISYRPVFSFPASGWAARRTGDGFCRRRCLDCERHLLAGSTCSKHFSRAYEKATTLPFQRSGNLPARRREPCKLLKFPCFVVTPRVRIELPRNRDCCRPGQSGKIGIDQRGPASTYPASEATADGVPDGAFSDPLHGRRHSGSN